MHAKRVKHLWRHSLSVITVFVMLLGMLPLASLRTAQAAPAADQTLTGSEVDGNLMITVKDTGTMGVWRYVSGAWQRQIYNQYAKGSRLYYDGSAYTLSKESTWVMNGTDPTLVSNSTSGNTITTVWTAGTSFRITQTTTYNDGNSYYRLQWDITNTSGASISDLRFFHGEDTYLQGGDNGAGWWDAANTTIGVQKDVSGVLQRMYLQGVTTPYGYDSIHYSTARNNANAGALTNTVDANESTDNGYALEWREASLADGATWNIVAFERFTSGAAGSVYVIAPISTDCTVGTSCDVTYQVSNPSGSPVEVNLSVNGDQPTWNPAITSHTNPVNVPASGSINAVVQVSPPAGTADGTVGNFTLTATPTGSGDAASDTAAVQAVGAAETTVQLDFADAFNADVVENTGDPVEEEFDPTGARMVTQAVAEANVPGDDDKGMPNDGIYPANSEHPEVILVATDDNDGNNAWKASGTVTETFAVSPTGQYNEVHIFASAGGAGPTTPAMFRVTLNYADTSSTTSSEFTVPDWFGDVSAPGYYLIDGMDRFQNPGYEDADTVAIFGFPLQTNSSKTLESIEIEITDNSAGSFVFFGGVATTASTFDTDGDGTPDGQDIDDDNDGIPDSVEIANAPASGDTDSDGIPDHRDLDSDNDGINDVHEAGGTDADGDGMHDGTQGELTTPPDTDGDGQPDYVDLDSDNDSVSDLVEGGSGATDADNDGVADGPDADGDGIVDDADDNDGQFGEDSDGGPQNTDGTDDPDYIDLDSDNDGTDDIDESGGNDGLDGDNDGVIDDDTDSDNDGIPDIIDADDDIFGGLGDIDTDGDGTFDAQDDDDDNDGIPDSVEIANAPGNGDTDGDGIPDHLDLDSDNDGINDVHEAGGTDADGDGMHDGTQGELTTPPDTDGDGQPDYVDLDSDNDSVSDLVEGGSGATDADNNGVADGPDADGDGIVDSADDNDGQFGEDSDPGPQNTDGTDNPDYIDPDSDDDGTDDIDAAGNGDLDGDNDGQIDDDADNDGDGIPDNVDDDDGNFGGLGDTDGDGILDSRDDDDDNDGIPDSVEIANAPGSGDTDGDGIPDHRDLDSDNDGINDVHEAGGTDADGDGMHDGTQGELTTPPDTDGDGQPDYVDLDSDNDSVSDLVEGGSGAADADDDGVADGPDADGDGIVDSADDNDGQFGEDSDGGPQNTDGTDNPDYIDPDSDDDGTDDIDENGNGGLDGDDDGKIDDDTDADKDGIPDNVDDDDGNFGGLGAPVSGQAPQAEDDAYTVPESIASTLNVLTNDSDPDGDAITITQVTMPQHGVVNIVKIDGTVEIDVLVYTPTAGYLGADTFTYTICDGDWEDSAQVTVTVLPATDLAVSQQIKVTFSGYEIAIVARNLGPRPAPGAFISDTFPAVLTDITWTCEASGGASCAASGSGQVLSETLTAFPAGGMVTYTITAAPAGNEIAHNTVTITQPEGIFDLYLDNNSTTRPTSYRRILPIICRNASF